MKKLITTDITTTAGLPFSGPTLNFLQDSYKEILNAICRGIFTQTYYNSSTAYVLFGCLNTGSGSNYIISEGAVYYQGEVYLVPAATFTIAGANIARLQITDVYLAGVDPVTFTDTNPHSVHQSKIMQPIASTSGIDYNTLWFYKKRTALTLNSPYTNSGTLNLGIRFERHPFGFVVIEGNLSTNASVTTGGIIATIPTIGGVNISTGLVIPCIVFDGTNNIPMCIVLRSNGEIRLSAKGSDWTTNTVTLPSGSEIYFNATYGIN
jgi:hypothetical protein